MVGTTTRTAILVVVAFTLGTAASATLAQTADNCTRHYCSNDAQIPETFGDEVIEWDPLPEWETRTCPETPDDPCVTDEDRRCYEAAFADNLDIIRRRCETTFWSELDQGWLYVPPIARFVPYAVGPDQFPEYGAQYRYVIRSCEGADCQAWQPRHPNDTPTPDYVEFRGGTYACFGVHGGLRCEEECYPGAPKRFSQIPDCPRS